MSKVYTQIHPPPTTLTADPRAHLLEEEQEEYQQVLDHFSRDAYTIPGIGNDAQLTEEEKFWLSRECFLRFLRASEWDSLKTIQRLERTLKWRRDFGIYDLISAKHVEPEAEKNEEIIFGYDTEGRPGYHIVPSRLSAYEPTPQVQLTFWMLERCIDLMGPGVESLTMLVDFADSRIPSIAIARSLLSILQEHYPERLGKAYVNNLSFFVNTFIKLIWPFIDSYTRSKIKFDAEVINEGYFKPEMIVPRSWAGTAEFEYDHDQYWPALVSLCEENKKKWLERWRSLGGTVGIKEWDYKKEDGDVTDSSQPAQAVEVAVAEQLQVTYKGSNGALPNGQSAVETPGGSELAN
ncbi:CRAL-TRIO domain containing protein [Amanita muscaria]